MRLKLFWKLGLTYLLLLLLTLAVVYLYTARVLERNSLESTFRELESFVRLAEARPPDLSNAEELAGWTDWMARSGARITVIARDGLVLADSDEEPSRMENHAGRPEIREAFREGRGRASRYSETVKRDLVYLAVRYDWGDDPPVVLRAAQPLVRVEEAIAEVRGPLGTVSIAALLIAGALSLVFSRLFSLRVERLKEFSKQVAEGDFTPTPVRDGGDELEELASSLNETASRMDQTIRSLEEERNQSSTILSSMSEGVAVVGADERVRYLNRSFREALGLGGESWEEFRGRELSELVPVEVAELARRALLNEQADIELSLTGPPKRQLLARAAPVSQANEAGVVLVLLDLSELYRLERVRRDFVANVSHELKTPLTAIQGFAETLLGGAMDEATNRRRFLEIIRQHSVRLGRLTDDLLKLSRIESGKHDPEIQIVRVPVLLEPLLETARLKAEPKRIRITVDCAPDLPAVESDAHWLGEVLQNLVDNAIQYTPENGNIRVTAAPFGEEVHISVADDGIGIPRESQSRIFERFYRVDPARSREVGGTGLGLAIAKHIVGSLGGSISVESEPGKGSAFTVRLPRTHPSLQKVVSVSN